MLNIKTRTLLLVKEWKSACRTSFFSLSFFLSFSVSLSLSLCLTPTHTHTHTQHLSPLSVTHTFPLLPESHWLPWPLCSLTSKMVSIDNKTADLWMSSLCMDVL